MKLTSNRIAGLICIYFIVLALNYVHAIPIFESSDEQAHFLYIDSLIKTKQLPTILTFDESVNPSDPARQWANENHQPPLYYLVGAALVAWTSRNDVADYLVPNPLIFIRELRDTNFNIWLHRPHYPDDTAVAVYILKLYSLMLATATLWFVYLTGKISFGAKIGLLAMAIVVSIPSFVANSISISNDGLVVVLYTAGVYWICRLWHQRMIRSRDIVVLSLILGLIPLSKVTGITLIGVVYLSLVIGVARNRYSLRSATTLIVVSVIAVILLSGWWYIRNLSIYGDLLAVKATQQVWNRTRSPITIQNQIKGVWDSFWMTFGGLSFRGPDWFYLYAMLISLVACFGLIRAWRTLDDPRRRDMLALLAVVCTVLILALVAGTQQIPISFGRILFPAIVAFAILLAIGWLHAFKSKIGALLLVPLASMTLMSLFSVLPIAYPPLEVVESVPTSAHTVNAAVGELKLVAYTVEDQVVSPGGSTHLQIYISGKNRDNPALSIKALDPVTRQLRGSTFLYPGMMRTDTLDSGVIYRTSMRLNIDPVDPASMSLAPTQLRLLIEWKTPYPERVLPWVDQQGKSLEQLEVAGPTLIDPTYQAPSPQFAANIVYGDAIQLVGYNLSTSTLHPNADLTVTLHWQALKHLEGNWTVGVGLLDHNQHVIVQADGMPAGYPTSAWQPGTEFVDMRTLTIPTEAKLESYDLYVIWYNSQNSERLPAHGDHVDNNTLYIAPTSIRIVAP